MGYLLLSCCCCSIRQRWQMPKSSWQSAHLLNKHSVIFYVHLWSYIYFVVRCNQWKDRNESDKLRDWFDGTQFLEEYKEWVSNEEYDLSICLLINIDWWQTYKRTVYSLGGMYAAVLNLPRDVRQKMDNIFTLGNDFNYFQLSIIFTLFTIIQFLWIKEPALVVPPVNQLVLAAAVILFIAGSKIK